MYNFKSHRMEAFSDGVIAITITLLAFELKVPHLQYLDIESSLREILQLLPLIFTFILSFITIAIFWVNHHQMTEHIENVNRRIIWSNMVFLMLQALIPFATRVIAENPFHSLSVATYGFILFCSSLAFSLLHLMIHRKITKTLTWNSRTVQRSLVGPIVYACAMIAALNSVQIAYVLLIIPPLYYFLPKKRQA